MTTVPPSNEQPSNVLSLWVNAQAVSRRRQAQGTDQMSRLEAELILRTSTLKAENEELQARVETLERCLKLIVDNLSVARELMGRLDIQR